MLLGFQVRSGTTALGTAQNPEHVLSVSKGLEKSSDPTACLYKENLLESQKKLTRARKERLLKHNMPTN